MNISIITACLLVLLSMTITWILQLKNKNAGIVDVTWSYNFSLIALVVYFLNYTEFSFGKFILLIMVLLWSGRLGTYLFIRNVGKKEDERYTQLRTDWGKAAQIKMLFFFYLQGFLNILLALPFFLYLLANETPIGSIEIIALIVFVIALSGESLADAQLKSFKNNPLNKGKVCKHGLWKYSRHPNYFFEWLIWISFFLFTLGIPYGYISLLSPLIILWTLIKATGIPMTEAQSIKSKGAQYIEYQKSTSAFIPWFTKK